MQFYIIHPDPETNVKLLPEYALKKVNVREGWQILSDIGHIHGVTFSEQNKQYSTSHVLTRSFCQNAEEFNRFMEHYKACVTAVGGTYFEKWASITADEMRRLYLSIPLIRSREQFALEYLLESKKKHLTDQEYLNLSHVRSSMMV